MGGTPARSNRECTLASSNGGYPRWGTPSRDGVPPARFDRGVTQGGVPTQQGWGTPWPGLMEREYTRWHTPSQQGWCTPQPGLMGVPKVGTSPPSMDEVHPQPDLMGGTQGGDGVPSSRGTPQYRTIDGVLDTPRSVCLLLSRRRTFLLCSIFLCGLWEWNTCYILRLKKHRGKVENTGKSQGKHFVLIGVLQPCFTLTSGQYKRIFLLILLLLSPSLSVNPRLGFIHTS